jgi:uncharacterized membrane protein YraQ (UPF0718 family)
MAAVFLAFFYLPLAWPRFNSALFEALALAKWYAREHVLTCLLPALFIAGGISVFVSQASVMKYLGARANKFLAYGVASVSGSILAVCSCTVLPLFAGIYKMGAGLGPATTFLYAGPAINVLAIVLTARILGLELGVARAVGAIVFGVVIGLAMHVIFRREEAAKVEAQAALPEPEGVRPLGQNALYFGAMVGVLVFANWGKPAAEGGIWFAVYSLKWWLASASALALAVILVLWFKVRWWKLALVAVPTAALAFVLPSYPAIPFTFAVVGFSVVAATGGGETQEWFASTWIFAKQILPLLFFGVVIAGALLGRPGQEGLIPSEWVSAAVGGNSLRANFFASIAGAFMYFATLTEVPIVEGLIGSGMGKGPALALLLAGPAMSLPSLLVIRSVMGTRKTLVFITLVVIMATATGMIYGALFA